MFWEMPTSGFGFGISNATYLSGFKVVPEPWQRNNFLGYFWFHRIRPNHSLYQKGNL